jgi:hypothetical protein
MTVEELLVELENLADEIGVTIRFEKGDFDGGYCILRAERMIVVNKKLSIQRKVSVISLALNEMGIENVFIKPAVRLFIEDEIARARTS